MPPTDETDSAPGRARACLAALPSPAPGARRVLVTAGPTAEDIDDVRFLTNRSTGRMGFAVAAEALRRGWQAVLVAGPTPGEPPEDAACLRVRSAREMLDAVLAAFPETDALVMAAAVADYTPAEPVRGKLKKTPGELHLRLIRTTDILAAVRDHPARAGRVVIGFALEAEPDPEEARRKLREKRLDGIVLNTPAAFGTESTAARLLLPGSEDPAGPFGRKTDLARAICDRIAAGSSSGSG